MKFKTGKTQLLEGVCINNKHIFKYIDCTFGCNEGICLKEFFDLAITNFMIEPIPIVYGEDFKVSYDVTNMGSKDTENLLGVQVIICKPDETSCHIPGYTYESLIKSGETKHYTFELPMTFNANIVDNKVKVIAGLVGKYDGGYKVFEDADNSNNVVGDVFDVIDITYIEINSVDADPSIIKQGEDVTFYVEVENMDDVNYENFTNKFS